MFKEISLIALQLLLLETDFQPKLRRVLFSQSFLQIWIKTHVKRETERGDRVTASGLFSAEFIRTVVLILLSTNNTQT